MRAHLVTVVVCLLAGNSPALAQAGMQGGVIGGPGWTALTAKSNTPVPDFSWGAGMAAGVYIASPASHGVGVEPEFLVSVKRSTAADTQGSETFRLTSIEIPVMLRLGAGSMKAAGLHVLFGPTFNVRLAARRITNVSGQSIDDDVSDQSRRGAVGLAAGAGVDVRRLRIDGRFTWGLTHLNTDTSDATSIKDHAFTLLFGVRLW
jgi:hypothetical protein